MTELSQTPNSDLVKVVSERLAGLNEHQRRAALAEFSAEELQVLEYHWPLWARPDQLPPPGNWRTWLYLAGRGAGKTRAMAENTHAEIESGRRMSIGLVSPTSDTGRRDQVKTLLEVAPPWFQPSHEPSQRRIVYPNGAICYVLTAEEPDRIRGLNLDWAWLDELSSMSNVEDTWSNLQLALRVPGPKGHAPSACISTTPKRQPLLKTIMADKTTVVTSASTFANAQNLDPNTLAYLSARYAGSTLGRQELMGELLDDADGALWNRAMIENCRRNTAPADFRRIVVAIDPSGNSGTEGAETGIIVVGLGPDKHGYVLEDMSGRYSPEGWARQAITSYRTHKADRIIAEKNYGGAMVESTIRAVDKNVPVRLVTASRGKAVRAEPVVALFEQQRVHFVGNFPLLEDQLCGWVPASNAPSPDRLDALVWAITDLMLEDTNYDSTAPGFANLVAELSGHGWLFGGPV